MDTTEPKKRPPTEDSADLRTKTEHADQQSSASSASAPPSEKPNVYLNEDHLGEAKWTPAQILAGHTNVQLSGESPHHFKISSDDPRDI